MVLMALLTVFLLPLPGRAGTGAPGLLLPMGGGYSDVYTGFSAAAAANARSGRVTILVLPTTYSTNATAISEAERQVNLRDADERRFQIEEACKRAAPAGTECAATLVPVFTRADAADPAALAPFAGDVSAVFILGGDQTVAMEALAGTPVETALAEAYARGAAVGGTSAGCGMLAAHMLAGYSPNFAAGNSLDFGAADMWNSPDRRGLPFGVQDAILDQHFFQRGRVGRLLNAIALPGVPHVGIGVDAYTGVRVVDGTRLEGVFGLYTVAVLDAETYHASDAVRYAGPANTLGLRNVLVHLLAPGDAAYDLTTRRHSLAAPAPRVEREFDALALPAGAGTLLLAGDLSQALDGNPVLARFVELSGGAQARVLIVAAGFPTDRSAQTVAGKYAAALGVPTVNWAIPVKGEPPAPPAADEYTAILFIGRDQSKFGPETLPARLAFMRDAWLAGKPVLADNAAGPVLGAVYSAHEPMPEESEAAEQAAQKSFLLGRTRVVTGLAWLNATFEPRVLDDNRWGRVFSLAYTHPAQVAFGLTQNTALEIGARGPVVIGRNVVLSLDLRAAQLALGANEGFVMANGLLDVFAPGDAVVPVVADAGAQPERLPTPALPTPAPTPAPAETAAPTVTPASTPTAAPTTTTTPAVAAASAAPPASGAAAPIAAIGLALVVIVAAATALFVRARLRRLD